MIEDNRTVTVCVFTYNSSAYVEETLESIKKQSWSDLILMISDDCSTDNTISVCKKWLGGNRDRFVDTKLLTIDHNTGTSANSNRAWDACTTEYFKGIAGDDILLPNCIEDNMAYVTEHPDAIFVFSRAKAFGVSPDRCRSYEQKAFDYTFFQMTPEQQYDRIKYGSCLPAATPFCNINKIREMGLRHDERIPFLEDRPKWINVIRKGIKFHFFDKETVLYRLHEKSLSNPSNLSPKFYVSRRLTFFYYVFDDKYIKDKEGAINEVVNFELEQYRKCIECIQERDKYYRLSLYRLLNIPKALFTRIRKKYFFKNALETKSIS